MKSFTTMDKAGLQVFRGEYGAEEKWESKCQCE